MLSVCIITKNQEKNIERCLKALSGYGFELVVVDTGSTDQTKKLAEKYTENVYEFAWCDDFAAAKNYAVSRAGNNLVLMVDSDEFLEPLTREAIEMTEEQLRNHPDEVGRIRIRNVFMRDGVQQENQEWINRIFDRRKFHYEGRIHEQIVSQQNKDYQTWISPLTFIHTGYDLSLEERIEKARRNIRLLEQELSQVRAKMEKSTGETVFSQETAELEGQLTYLLYQLGKSYYIAGDYQQACAYFSEGLSYDLNPSLEYVIDMVETYGYALLNSGQEQTALFFENIYQEFGKSADFQFLMGLIYMKNARFEDAVQEFEKALCQKECRSVGVNSYAASYNIGVIYECLGNTEKAKAYYLRCGEYSLAQKRLESMV